MLEVCKGTVAFKMNDDSQRRWFCESNDCCEYKRVNGDANQPATVERRDDHGRLDATDENTRDFRQRWCVRDTVDQSSEDLLLIVGFAKELAITHRCI